MRGCRERGRAEQQRGGVRVGLSVGLGVAGGAREQQVDRGRARQPRRVVLGQDGVLLGRWPAERRGAVRVAALARLTASMVRVFTRCRTQQGLVCDAMRWGVLLAAGPRMWCSNL